MATNRKGRNKIAFLYLQSIDLIKNRVGTAGWRIDFDFLIVNGAIYQKLSSFTHKSLMPAQKFNVFQRVNE